MLTQVDVTKFASYSGGMRDGIEKGRLEGELKKAQEVACHLLQLGVIPEGNIARIAGLSLEEVQKLRVQH